MVPAGPFTKALQVEVTAAASLEARDQAGAHSLKVWVGLLAKAIADTVAFDRETDPDVFFMTPRGETALPYAEALVRVANEHFAFWSPASEAGEERLRKLEQSVQDLSSTIQRLMERPALLPAQAKRASKAKAARKPEHAEKPEGSVPGTPKPRGSAAGLSGLDPSVVRAAVAAGIDANELAEVQGLLGAGLSDFPPGGVGDLEGPASLGAEAGDEELDGGPELTDPHHSAVDTAVLTLTAIVKELAVQRKKPEKTWEAVLDGADSSHLGDGFSSSGTSGSRSKAAAFRVLSACSASSHCHRSTGLRSRVLAHSPGGLARAPASAGRASAPSFWTGPSSRRPFAVPSERA